MAQQHGSVKFFDTAKGFGFIVPDGGGDDIFFHAQDCKQSGIDLANNPPQPDQRLSFDLAPGRNGKGPKAVSITRL